MTHPALPFGTRLIGQTEKALDAILSRLLGGTGVSETHWVALSLAIAAGPSASSPAVTASLATALQVPVEDAERLVAELVGLGLLEAAGDGVSVTGRGGEFSASVRASVDRITARLWGELDAEDVAVAARVLNAVLANARTELAAPVAS